MKTFLQSLKHFKSDEIFQQSKVKIDDVQLHKAPFSHEMQSSLKAHAAGCEIFGCVKSPCFIVTPDIIKRKKTVTVESVRKDMIRRRKNKPLL